MAQHKSQLMLSFDPIPPSRTNLVQNPWDYHGTENVCFSETEHRYSPRKPGTCIMKVTLRVVSNLSFTAKFARPR